MRNARKRRMKRKYGNVPTKCRTIATTKRHLNRLIVLSPRRRALSLDDL